MQVLYREERFEDVERIVDWCRENSTSEGGLFEVYSDPGGINRFMIAINILQNGDHSLKPLGAFYCNFIAPGTISLDEDPQYEGVPSRFENISRVKKVIDRLFRDAQSGVSVDLSDLLETI